MSTPPVVVVEKKRGWGCCGCGCFTLALLALLFAALLAGIAYVGNAKINKLTSTSATPLPTVDNGDAVAQAVQKKCDDFMQAVQARQAATLDLSADEINTWIAHNPNYASSGAHVLVTFIDDKAQIQFSVPFSAFKLGILDDRFANGSVTFTPNFDLVTKSLVLTFKDMKFGDDIVPENYLPMMQNVLSQSVNQQVKANPQGKEILDNAQSIQIRDGRLLIDTQ